MDMMMRDVVGTMESFGETLDQVKELISEIIDEIRQQTKNLELDPEIIDEQVAMTFKSEYNFEEKISELKEELELLEEMKQIQTQTTEIEKSSLPDVRNTAFGKLVCENVKAPNHQFDRVTPEPMNPEKSRKNEEWWKVDYDLLEYEKENVDWKEELFKRNSNRLILKVTHGWNKKLTTCKDIENTLRTFLDSKVDWGVKKTDYTRSDGGPVVWIRFGSVEDCLKTMEMAKKADGFDGFFKFSTPRTNIELLEKRKMQRTVDMLRARKYRVDSSEEMKIKVDGKYWKYCWGEGWRQL